MAILDLAGAQEFSPRPSHHHPADDEIDRVQAGADRRGLTSRAADTAHTDDDDNDV